MTNKNAIDIIKLKIAAFFYTTIKGTKSKKSLHIRYNFIFYFIVFNLPFILTLLGKENLLLKISEKFKNDFSENSKEILILYPFLTSISIGIVLDFSNFLIEIARYLINIVTELFGISLDPNSNIRKTIRNQCAKKVKKIKRKHKEKIWDLQKDYNTRLENEIRQLVAKQKYRDTARPLKPTPSPQRTPE